MICWMVDGMTLDVMMIPYQLPKIRKKDVWLLNNSWNWNFTLSHIRQIGIFLDPWMAPVHCWIPGFIPDLTISNVCVICRGKQREKTNNNRHVRHNLHSTVESKSCSWELFIIFTDPWMVKKKNIGYRIYINVLPDVCLNKPWNGYFL